MLQHNSPAHGEVRDQMHHVMGRLPHLGADDANLLVLVVATDVTRQPQGHHRLMAVVVSEDQRQREKWRTS